MIDPLISFKPIEFEGFKKQLFENFEQLSRDIKTTESTIAGGNEENGVWHGR